MELLKLGNFVLEIVQNLPEIRIPINLVKIPKNCFLKCRKLNNVIIPDSVTLISERSFRECDELTDIILPTSVARVGPECFLDCKSLKTFQSLNPELKPSPNFLANTPFMRSCEFYLSFEEVTDLSFSEETCLECQKQYDSDRKPFFIKRCNHTYCRECLEKLIQTTFKCPQCDLPFVRFNPKY